MRAGMFGRTVAAALVGTLAISCGDEEPDALAGGGATSSGASSSGGASGSVHEACWQAINDYRRTKSLPPYERWSEGESCADDQSKSDAVSKKAHGSFARCGEFAQNECPGIPGPAEEAIPKCLELMWAEGPGGGHYGNMASTKYTKVACGVFVTAGGAIWSVQNFR